MPLATILLQILATYGPQVFAAAVAIAHHPAPTKEDFLGILDSIAKEDYDSIIAARREARGLIPGPGPTPAPDAYSIDYTSELAATAAGKPGDHVYDKHDGKFRLVYGGAGGAVNPAWTLVSTIGG